MWRLLQPAKSRQTGSMLLEALFGILIFSMGILALVGLQASSVKQISSGKYRTDASLLANELLGEMWVSNRVPATLATAFASPSGASYLAWKDRVAASLPGVAAYPPSVTLTTVSTVVGVQTYNVHSQATITVQWKLPNEPVADPAHRFVLVAQVK